MTETVQPAGAPAEDIRAQALPVLVDVYRNLIQERPEVVPDLEVFVGASGTGPQAITETLAGQGGQIGEILAQAAEAEAQAIAEAGLQPEAQAAALAAELTVDTVEKLIEKPVTAICEGPLLAAVTELAQELQADPDADPAELAELGDEEYALIFDELLGDLFDETAG